MPPSRASLLLLALAASIGIDLPVRRPAMEPPPPPLPPPPEPRPLPAVLDPTGPVALPLDPRDAMMRDLHRVEGAVLRGQVETLPPLFVPTPEPEPWRTLPERLLRAHVALAPIATHSGSSRRMSVAEHDAWARSFVKRAEKNARRLGPGADVDTILNRMLEEERAKHAFLRPKPVQRFLAPLNAEERAAADAVYEAVPPSTNPFEEVARRRARGG